MYMTAWFVRFLNRALLVMVAVVTIMWMLFLLDMNAASVRQQKLSYQQALRNRKSIPRDANKDRDNDLFNKIEADLKWGDYNPPAIQPAPIEKVIAQNNPEIGRKDVMPVEEIRVEDEKRDSPVVREPESNVKNPKPKPPIEKKTVQSDRDHVVKKPKDDNKPLQSNHKPRDSPVDNAGQAVVNGDNKKPVGFLDSVDSLQDWPLLNLMNAPPLQYARFIQGNCFCVTSTADSQLKLSAIDAAKVGCPKQENFEFRCLPTVFIAGCNNCGVTDLQYRLNKHQLISFGAKKEPEFWTGKFSQRFGQPDDLNHYSLDQYGDASAAILSAVRQKKRFSMPIIAEMAPTMYYSMIGKWGKGGPPIPDVLHKILPKAKILFLLRDPIQRSIAQYNALPGTDKSPENFEEVVDKFIDWYKLCTEKRKWDPRNCLYGVADTAEKFKPMKILIHDIINSIYHVPIQEWISKFGRHTMVILKFEDYMENRLETIEKHILHKIGAKNYTQGPYKLLQDSESDKTLNYETPIKIDMNDATREKLKQFFKPLNEKLATLLGDPSFTWNY